MSLCFQIFLLANSIFVNFHFFFQVWFRTFIFTCLALIYLRRFVSSYLSDISGLLLLADDLLELQSEINNHFDQLNFLYHDIHVVFVVNLLLLINLFFKTCLRILEIYSLVLIILLDIWVNLNIRHLLILNIWIKILINNPLID